MNSPLWQPHRTADDWQDPQNWGGVPEEVMELYDPDSMRDTIHLARLSVLNELPDDGDDGDVSMIYICRAAPQCRRLITAYNPCVNCGVFDPILDTRSSDAIAADLTRLH